MATMTSYTIEDDLGLAEGAAIEVVVVLSSGERRLAWFALPRALPLFGEWLPGTQTRFHVGLIVVEQLSDDIIRRTLRHLSDTGQLVRATHEMA